MTPVSRHQCLIYEGAPSQQLSALAAAIREKLHENYRCLCLDSPPIVAEMYACLAAANIDTEMMLREGRLILSSEPSHLVDGRFDTDRLLGTLEETLHQTLRDGFAGLWATGDMNWEMGSDRNFPKLLEYEWRLEELCRSHPEMGGVCQYAAGRLPRTVLRQGALVHRSFFVNEHLSLLNPYAAERGSFRSGMAENLELDAVIACLCHAAGAEGSSES